MDKDYTIPNDLDIAITNILLLSVGEAMSGDDIRGELENKGIDIKDLSSYPGGFNKAVKRLTDSGIIVGILKPLTSEYYTGAVDTPCYFMTPVAIAKLKCDGKI